MPIPSSKFNSLQDLLPNVIIINIIRKYYATIFYGIYFYIEMLKTSI